MSTALNVYRADCTIPLGLVKHNNVLTEDLSARRSRAGLLRPALLGEAT